MGILSLVSRLALKHCLSPRTARAKGPRGHCSLQTSRTQAHPKGAREELENRGAVLIPGIGMAPLTKPHCPQRGWRALPKASHERCTWSPIATPSTNQAKYYRELSALRDAFFPRTPDPQCNWKSDLLRHRPAPFPPSSSKKPGRALDNFLKAWCHL